LANIEIWIHAVLNVVIIGWDSGFHYYTLAIPFALFLSLWPTNIKIIVCILNGTALVILNYYANITPPLSAINPVYVDWLNYANIIGILFAISYCSYYYRLIVLRIEKKLEVEHQRTNEVLNQLNDELSDAADYVKSILPEPINEGPVRSQWKFIPSESLGGDAFGYHWLDKDNFAIYLLDVSGHGVRSALLSITIMNILRSLAMPLVDFREPDQVLSALNRSFPADKNSDMYYTIWYGVYNRRKHNLAYASGGHPAALLFSGSPDKDTPVVELSTPNFFIGGMENATYKKDVQSVKPNSCIYIFSDGVFEFEQSDGSRWKFREFVNFLRELHSGQDKDIDRLVNSAMDLKQSRFEDDFTILKVSFH
jgi:sigma-B regulation protein RsbU (phosphoserine phosphatase)